MSLGFKRLIPKIPHNCSWHSLNFLGLPKGNLLYADCKWDDDIEARIRDLCREAVEAHFNEQSYRLSRERIAYLTSAVTYLPSECSLDTNYTRNCYSKNLFWLLADDVVISPVKTELPTNSGVREYSDFSHSTLFEGSHCKKRQALFSKKYTAHWYSILHLQNEPEKSLVIRGLEL